MSRSMNRRFIILLSAVFITFFQSSYLLAQDDKDSIGPVDSDGASVYGSLEGEAGVYYEGKFYEKDTYSADGETIDLDDSHLIVPYMQINYRSPEYYGFGAGAGLTVYSQYDETLSETDAMDDNDHYVFHELFLQYSLSESTVRIGRQELEDTTFLKDYYEALNIKSEDIDNVFLQFVYIEKVAESDITKFIKFEDIGNGDSTSDDEPLYALEMTLDISPAIHTTLYYYHQDDVYDLYGTHLKLHRGKGGHGIGLNFDFYMTDEQSESGLRDADNEIRDSNIFHLNPFVRRDEFSFNAGYIKAEKDVGAREGGALDDYFNPLNEGDKVYEPDAETWYSSFLYESDRFDIEFVYGRTTYADDSILLEEEFDLNGRITLYDHVNLDAAFSAIQSEAPEGSVTVFEAVLTYEF